MKKSIKSIVKAILVMGVIAGFILMLGEGKSFKQEFIWNMSWMAEMLISGCLLVKLFPEDFKEVSL